MRDNLDNILNSGECLSEEMMLNYLEGKLTTSEQHRVEKHLLECEFCSDALEGLAATGVANVRADLDGLGKKIDSRVNQSPGKVVQFKWAYRAAAVVAIVALFGGGFYYLQSMKKSERVFTENFQPFRDTTHSESAVAPAATVPAEEQSTVRDIEKSGPAALKKEEQNLSRPKKDAKSATGNSNVYTVTTATSQGPTSAQSAAQGDARAEDVSTSAPASGYSRDQAINTDEAKATKRPDANESKDKNPEELSKTNDDTKQSREEQYTFSKSASAKEKKIEPSMPSQARLEEVVIVADSINTGQTTLIKEGIRLYEEKNYSAAVTTLQQALKMKPGNPEALFYSGVSQLSLNEGAVAINLLESVIKNSPNKFTDAAKWYLSLAYINRNKISKAKKLLEDLAGGSSEYKSNAQKTLDELK